MTQLERYEWCDFWWEEATSQHGNRVLLIGDSITRGYRPHLNKLLHGIAYVDMLATSKAVDNPSLFREMDYILYHQTEFTYQVIHINSGLHGFHLSVAEYEHHYDRVIGYLLEHSHGAKLVVALTTPVTKEGEPGQLNSAINDKVIERNKAAERLAAKYNLELNDLYSRMLGKSDYRAADGYHYNSHGEQAQAGIVAEKLKLWLV
jgi:lysophospholipase L1-like esterase